MQPHGPWDGGHGPHEWEGSVSVLPYLAGFLLLVIAVLGLVGWYLWRSGLLTLPKLGRPQSAEDEARRILSDRFARGEISSEEFLERAGALNWSPGTETLPSRSRRRIR